MSKGKTDGISRGGVVIVQVSGTHLHLSLGRKVQASLLEMEQPRKLLFELS